MPIFRRDRDSRRVAKFPNKATAQQTLAAMAKSGTLRDPGPKRHELDGAIERSQVEAAAAQRPNSRGDYVGAQDRPKARAMALGAADVTKTLEGPDSKMVPRPHRSFPESSSNPYSNRVRE